MDPKLIEDQPPRFHLLALHLLRLLSVSLPKEVEEGAMQVDEIEEVDLQLVWDPPWSKDMMTDAAKLECNI